MPNVRFKENFLFTFGVKSFIRLNWLLNEKFPDMGKHIL